MTEFFIRFMLASVTGAAVLLLILLVKRFVRPYISPKGEYMISILSLFLLFMPLLPVKWSYLVKTELGLPVGLFSDLLSRGTASDGTGGLQTGVTRPAANVSWLQDMVISVERPERGVVITCLILIWIAGMAAVAWVIFKSNRNLKWLRESVITLSEGRIFNIFLQSQDRVKVRRMVRCGTSILAKTPMTLGFIRPMIVIPSEALTELSDEELYYILLHELSHCRRGDILLNYIICALQMIYWFNPFVHLLAGQMQQERELACDADVLEHLAESQYKGYGMTLLRYVQIVSQYPAIVLSVDLGGSKERIKRRLEYIAVYRGETKLRLLKDFLIFMLTTVIIAGQIPILAVFASISADEEPYDFTGSQVIYEDLTEFFNGMDGSFVLYDTEAEVYTIHDQERSVKRTAPASTYKIYSALIALDQGVISLGDSDRLWNGTGYPFDSWNRDQDLQSAMEHSVTWYFQELDRQVGKRELRSYFSDLSYGNHNVSGSIDEYWMESSLKISPVEQVELLTEVYQNRTIFKPEHVEMVKDSMYLSDNGEGVLFGKTGSGVVNGRGVTGWFIGYVELEGRTFVFAANVEGDDGAAGSTAAEITLSILSDKGIYR